MAKSTRDKGKNAGEQPATGPILVDLAAENKPEPPPEEDDSEEEAAEAAAAETARDPRRIPPSTNLTGPQMWAFIAQYPSPQDLDLYVYRLFPVILAGPPPDWTGGNKWYTYQEKVKGMIAEQTGRVVDYEWLRNVRGSGTYHLRLIDRRLKRTQNRQVCEAKVEVNEWETHPPVLNDWSELVPAEANKWIINRLLKDKVIRRNAEGGFVAYQDGGAQQQQNSAQQGPSLTEAVNLAERLAKTMTPKESASMFSGKDMVDLIKSQAAQNDPQKVIDAAKGLVEISRPPEDKEGKGIVSLLLAQLQSERDDRAVQREREREERTEQRERDREDRAEQRRLMTELMTRANTPPPAPPPAPDPVQTMKAQAEAFTAMREAFGGGEAAGAQSRMNGWQEFLKEPLVEFMGLIKPFAQVGAAVMASKVAANQQTQTQQARPAPAAQSPQPASIQQPGVTEGPEQQQPGQQPGNQPGQPGEGDGMPVDPVMLGLSIVLKQADPTLRAFFRDKTTGDQFAGDWFCATDFAIRSNLPPNFPAAFRSFVPETLNGMELLDQIRPMSGSDADGNVIPSPQWAKAILIATYRNDPQWPTLAPTPAEEARFEKFISDLVDYQPEDEGGK